MITKIFRPIWFKKTLIFVNKGFKKVLLNLDFIFILVSGSKVVVVKKSQYWSSFSSANVNMKALLKTNATDKNTTRNFVGGSSVGFLHF